jgi:hypothetical protein
VTARRIVVVLVLALAAAACDGGADGASPSPSPPSPSAEGVTQASADEALAGLCQVQASSDVATAEAAFLDRSHATLHALAAATSGTARDVSAQLLIAKQRVEGDLRRASLPPTFAGDIQALIEATVSTIEALGLDAGSCAT